MNVAALPAGHVRRRLRSSGLRLQLGPIVVAIRSPFRNVSAALAHHYAAYPVVDDDAFADFEVSVDADGVRRYVKPQAVFRFDGYAPFRPLAAAHAFPLLEWGLNWCVSAHCHQYLVIHSAVVERGGRAMILPAPPGSGKSTLCAALVASGWRLLSDELALIDIASGRIVPLPRPISLKNESIAAIAHFWPGACLGPVAHNTLKGSVAYANAPRTSVALSRSEAAPGWIVVPQFQPGASTTLETISKATGFMQLAESAFNYSLHGQTGFDVLAQLIDASDCFRFTYGGGLREAVSLLDELAGSP